MQKEKHILQWHITHLCNLRCSHCYQEEYNNHMPKEDFYNYLKKYEEFLENKNLMPQINLTGGEPLLHPNFFEFATEIVKRNIKLGILTNGTLIDEFVAKKIKELNPVFVQVSLDGIETTHDEIRGIGNFKKALLGIDLLKKENVKVIVSFTIQQSNYKDYEKLAKICNEHNVDKLWWDRIVTYTEEDNKTKALTTEQFKEMIKTTNKLKKKFKFYKKTTYLSNERSLQFIGTNDCGYHCGAGKNLIIFLANGDVMPCRRLPFIIGNLKNDSLENIIKNSQLMHDLKFYDTPIECLSCVDCERCKGGSKCVTYAQTKELFKKDINCFKNRKR